MARANLRRKLVQLLLSVDQIRHADMERRRTAKRGGRAHKLGVSSVPSRARDACAWRRGASCGQTHLSVHWPKLAPLALLSLPLSTPRPYREGVSGASRGRLAAARDGVEGPAEDEPEKTSAPAAELAEEPGTALAPEEEDGPRSELTSESTSARRDGRAGEPAAWRGEGGVGGGAAGQLNQHDERPPALPRLMGGSQPNTPTRPRF